ncbi:MAG: hypothetical protein ACK5D5_01650 [Bacteroidota bacterium]|jgi:hypothetical protein
MKNNSKILFGIIVNALFFLSSCKKDKAQDPISPPPQNESELITTVKLFFTDSSNTSNTSVFSFKDPDGEGGNAPIVFDTINLAANKTYFVSILLLDESKSPSDTISNEVLEEANDHMFFYHHSGLNISTSYLDLDSNNPPLPIGLETKWKTGSVSNGTSQVILKHQPGIKNGSETPGETDIDLIFSTKIQ